MTGEGGKGVPAYLVDRSACTRVQRRIRDVEVEDARARLLQQLAAAVAKQLVQADLHLKSEVAVLDIHLKVCGFDEGDGLVGGFSAKNVAERDVLEAEILADVVHVRDVDACRLALAAPSRSALSRLLAGFKLSKDVPAGMPV